MESEILFIDPDQEQREWERRMTDKYFMLLASRRKPSIDMKEAKRLFCIACEVGPKSCKMTSDEAKEKLISVYGKGCFEIAFKRFQNGDFVNFLREHSYGDRLKKSLKRQAQEIAETSLDYVYEYWNQTKGANQ